MMSRFLITATWDDVPHLNEEVKAELLASIPSNQREARTKGIPYLGIGQYFPQFTPQRHVISHKEALGRIKPWHKHWLSGDWGYDHPFCIHKHAMDEYSRVVTYGELWGRQVAETELGRKIGQWCTGQKFIAFVFSWDAGKLSTRSNPKFPRSIGQMISDALPPEIPRPHPADSSPGSRIAGARLMSNVLDNDLWAISEECGYLIDCLPGLIKDPDNPEDVLKVDHSEDQLGDDPYDGARMGLQHMFSGSVLPPVAVVAERKVADFAKSRGKEVEDLDINAQYMLQRRAEAAEQIRRRKKRGGLGRIWRPQN